MLLLLYGYIFIILWYAMLFFAMLFSFLKICINYFCLISKYISSKISTKQNKILNKLFFIYFHKKLQQLYIIIYNCHEYNPT